MAIFFPDYLTEKVVTLTPEKLTALGISALLLDVDNTLTTHDNPVPYDGVMDWLESLKQAGFALVIVSNNHPERVEPFAKLLGLPYVADGAKPLPTGYRRAVELLGMTLEKEKAAAVGDQIFTDIIGGKLRGVRKIMDTEITPEHGWFFKVKRRLEQWLMTERRMAKIPKI